MTKIHHGNWSKKCKVTQYVTLYTFYMKGGCSTQSKHIKLVWVIWHFFVLYTHRIYLFIVLMRTHMIHMSPLKTTCAQYVLPTCGRTSNQQSCHRYSLVHITTSESVAYSFPSVLHTKAHLIKNNCVLFKHACNSKKFNTHLRHVMSAEVTCSSFIWSWQLLNISTSRLSLVQLSTYHFPVSWSALPQVAHCCSALTRLLPFIYFSSCTWLALCDLSFTLTRVSPSFSLSLAQASSFIFTCPCFSYIFVCVCVCELGVYTSFLCSFLSTLQERTRRLLLDVRNNLNTICNINAKTTFKNQSVTAMIINEIILKQVVSTHFYTLHILERKSWIVHQCLNETVSVLMGKSFWFWCFCRSGWSLSWAALWKTKCRYKTKSIKVRAAHSFEPTFDIKCVQKRYNITNINLPV